MKRGRIKEAEEEAEAGFGQLKNGGLRGGMNRIVREIATEQRAYRFY
jgi:hypothetical protein